ncbi:MAG: hypothetical protein OEZ43_20935 [Gammaproteobacteria bacterium]|nr:hypothetical protein [Gammaproteobacteria bacterium]
MKQIIVKVKNVYGQDKIYPVCNAAQTFARIAGTRTLTPEVMSQIKKLGYVVTEERTPMIDNILASFA